MPDLLERLKSALGDRYGIEKEIGRGGMAVVFLAEDLKHRRSVALKVLHPELTATLGAERFLQEIEIVAGLQHPHILPLYDSGEADGLLYYVMPYAEGESLRQRLDREKQLAVDESVRLTVEVADGLDYAHRQGVVHRDIKPGNILLAEGHATIADFGIARAVEAARQERITRTGLGVGTPLYASPEQATAQETLDGRTDIYSLGCVLYEMLAGEPPLTGATPQMIQARRLSETPTAVHTLRDTVPPALDHVIARALAKVPADRFATASQFGQALQAVMFSATPAAMADLAATPGALAMAPTMAPPQPTRKVSRWLSLGVPSLVAVVILGWFLTQRFASPEAAGPVQAPALTTVQLTHDGSVTRAIISPDGSHLAFAADERGGAIRLAVVEIGASQAERTLAVLEELGHLRWLPDGSSIVFNGTYMGQRGGYSVSRMGGTVQFSQMMHRRPSPDGTECLRYEQPWKHLEIDTLCGRRGDAHSSEGIDSIPIAGTYEWVSGAEYSPRGDYILVSTLSGSGGGSIRSVSRDGAEQHEVISVSSGVSAMFWRSNGTVLYFVQDLASGPELMRLATHPSGEPDGELQPLLQLGDSLSVAEMNMPRFGDISADSKGLIALKTRVETRIVRLHTDRDDSVTVEPVAGTDNASSLRVSPDGRWIAFLASSSGGVDVYKVPVQGGSPERLTSPGTVIDFAWSPNGEMLAFSAPWQDTVRVWFMPAQGGRVVRLAGNEVSRDADIEWAPGPLMYMRPGNRNHQVLDSLFVWGDDGPEPMTHENVLRGIHGGVIGVGRPLVANDSVGWLFLPRSSPDGRWVAALWARSVSPAGARLWKISLTDTTQVPLRRLTMSNELPSPPAWTPDGQSIYSTGDDGVVLTPSAGGDSETVLRLPEGPTYECSVFPPDADVAALCVEKTTSAEAWLIENFDPHVN